MHIFTTEEAVVAVGVQMLVITSWNFAANGIIFSCSSMFQALGNTWPTISSSAVRLVDFRRAGAVAIYPAGVPAGACLVRVGGEHVPAGGDFIPAAAQGVRQRNWSSSPRMRPPRNGDRFILYGTGLFS